jgi:hypothetical protein
MHLNSLAPYSHAHTHLADYVGIFTNLFPSNTKHEQTHACKQTHTDAAATAHNTRK